MTTEDLVAVAITGTFLLFMLLELLVPARAYPARRLWRLQGVVGFVIMVALATVVPLALPAAWLEQHRLLDLSALPMLPGAAIGYLVVSFVTYVWHRSTHRFDFLWRGFHQLHHAPARLDTASSTIFHPLDLAMYIALSTVTSVWVLGLSAEAAALTGFIAQFYSFFQHLNVRTPRWLGYVIQRPEAHFVHHGRDVHAFNYADFPLWDLLFGTHNNPASFGTGDVGYAEPADSRYGAMLVFRDVSSGVGTRGPVTAAAAATAVTSERDAESATYVRHTA